LRATSFVLASTAFSLSVLHCSTSGCTGCNRHCQHPLRPGSLVSPARRRLRQNPQVTSQQQVICKFNCGAASLIQKTREFSVGSTIATFSDVCTDRCCRPSGMSTKTLFSWSQ